MYKVMIVFFLNSLKIYYILKYKILLYCKFWSVFVVCSFFVVVFFIILIVLSGEVVDFVVDDVVVIVVLIYDN